MCLLEENGVILPSQKGTFFSLSLPVNGSLRNPWDIQNEPYTITDLEWIGISNNLAVCTYNFKSDGLVGRRRQVYLEHGTNVPKKTRRAAADNT